MWRAICVTAILARTARADEVDDLVAKGQELAKSAEWTQAIAQFKAADAKRPRAQHACMIGLAYTRRELWAQAELYFARCRSRATAGDPLPDWLGDAEAQLAAKVAGAGVPPLTVVVAPAAATAAISISGFEPDEVVAPGTFHLMPGRYTLDISAPGYAATRREIVVEAGKAQTVDVKLEAPVSVLHTDATSNVPWIVAGAGAALVVGGLVTDFGPLRSAHGDLQSASHDTYPMYEGSYDAWRGVTIGLLVGGAVVAGIGGYLVYREHASVTVSARIDRDGGGVVIGWTR